MKVWDPIQIGRNQVLDMLSSQSHVILNCLRRLVSGLHVASRRTEKHLGMSAAQLFALSKLQDGKKRSLNELALLTYTHQSSLSVVIRKLIEKGLVQSQPAPEDSRRLMLGVTAKGRRILKRSSDSIQDRLLEALSEMDVEDQVQLAVLLNKLLDRADMSEARPELFFEYEDKREETYERQSTSRTLQQ